MADGRDLKNWSNENDIFSRCNFTAFQKAKNRLRIVNTKEDIVGGGVHVLRVFLFCLIQLLQWRTCFEQTYVV